VAETWFETGLSIPAVLYAVTTKKYVDPLCCIGNVTEVVFPRSVFWV
jgi:hypothetical protein